MANRRVLSLWFPRFAAERALRGDAGAALRPFAVVGEEKGAQILVSLNAEAESAGLRVGQPLRDAQAICPHLAHIPLNPPRQAAFLAGVQRWAGKFSPWVAPEGEAGLVMDITGCAHLFGGEAALAAQLAEDCADFGLSLRLGLADTRGAAWALARYGGQQSGAFRSGDAVDQEARATRSRAGKRRSWEVMAERVRSSVRAGHVCMAPPGAQREVLGPLPIAALRLEPEVVDSLHRLGLRTVRDVLNLPRAPFARRFGAAALRRLDQALGQEPEPISPARAAPHFAVRLSFPDPIGLRSDIEAGVDRLLPRLCASLQQKGQGARLLRLQAFRADGAISVVDLGLARAANTPARMRPLLWLKLDQIDAGFGIDCLRLSALQTEAVSALQHAGHFDASRRASLRQDRDTGLDDLIGKLGARLGSEAIVRLLPSQSHIPALAAQTVAAAWMPADVQPWALAQSARPLQIFPPEMVDAAPPTDMPPTPPERFRWRRRDLALRSAVGPERILPEWWFDNPEWRTGPRDYWQVETTLGERLWLFYAVGGAVSGGWFCEGRFA